MDVIILCGGKGTRLSEETSLRPKPMVEIGEKPILWHIMKYYSSFGFKRFILALGYKASFIKEYFYNYRISSSDFTLSMSPEVAPMIHNLSDDRDWEVTFVDTGVDTLKGGRIKRLEKFIKTENFHLTYGDGLSNVDLDELVKFHNAHGKLATVSAVRPPSRFGELIIENDEVLSFDEKAQMHTGYINGGFFVLNKGILNYLTEDQDCDFEFGPLQKLSRERQLKAYRHDGFWQCMDNVRERNFLNKLANEAKAPWVRW